MASSTSDALRAFENVTFIDFEFQGAAGDLPDPLCLVCRDLRTGQVKRFWRDDLKKLKCAPFQHGSNDLVVTFYGSAEFGCMLQLGWALPCNHIDLFVEHRIATNGLPGVGRSLVDVLTRYGLPNIGAAHKEAMRDKVLMQTSWTESEREEILDYCQSDVDALGPLLEAMLPTMDLPRALHRGRYAYAVARMERVGIPIDVDVWKRLVRQWRRMRLKLIEILDSETAFYLGTIFKAGRFSAWLRKQGIPWPRKDGRLLLDDDTFKEQSLRWSSIRPIREMRQVMQRTYISELQVGKDGRNRTLLAPYASKTGRNQPSAKKFVFGPSKWQRGLIKAPVGHGLAYIDYSSQEYAVAAGLSGDQRMIADYDAGDPYIALAIHLELVPPAASRVSHPAERELCKAIVLGLSYGLGPERLAYQAGISVDQARLLYRRHRDLYPAYWKFIESTVDAALQMARMSSILGWQRIIVPGDQATSMMNFPMQANSADMMRIAAIAATEAGIQVCAPIHDAFLIIAPTEKLDDDIARMRELMTKAGEVISGMKLRTDVKTFIHPERFMEERSIEMWNTIVKLAGIPNATIDQPSCLTHA